MESKPSFQNNGKLKLFIIVGTRPEIIRLSEVIKKCRVYAALGKLKTTAALPSGFGL